MKNTVIFAAIICCLVWLAACQKNTDTEAEKAIITELINSHNQAILDGDLDAILAENLDDQITYSVGRGEILKFTQNDTKRIFADQFKNGRYTGAKNLITPIIGFSPDGNMAWIINKIEFKYNYTDSTGNAKEVQFVDAVLAVMEKRDGKWVDVASAETFENDK